MSNDNGVVKLVAPSGDIKCHECGETMRKISWKITAGAYDAGKEVEQYVFECPKDKNTTTIEMTTGQPSEFAHDVDISFTKM
ncbi:MAG: hypothetical protein WBP26_02765 [Candidatus Saccharimonadales bacterium]